MGLICMELWITMFWDSFGASYRNQELEVIDKMESKKINEQIHEKS